MAKYDRLCSQETFLNASSIKSNIAYGVVESDIEDDKVIKASEMANIYNFIKSLPEGMNTEVGENGIKSEGTRTKIILLERFIKTRNNIIFDEATSSLDVNTEREIIKAINNLKNHKTLISISHKKTTMLYCDEIYEIKTLNLQKKMFNNKTILITGGTDLWTRMYKVFVSKL